MTAQLLVVRPMPGSVDEHARVAHVVEASALEQRPDRLKTRCGLAFAPGELELLGGPAGMPCEECLRRSASTYVNGSQQARTLDAAIESGPAFVPRPDAYVYEQLADHIASAIEAGQLRPGTALPSERKLAKDHDVSLGTARHATDLLRLRGLVVTIRSKGTYVTDPRNRPGRWPQGGKPEMGV